MAYEKLNLSDGDTLKAEHLNHMEDGIEETNKAIVSVGGDTLTWDGNTEGLVNVENLFYKLSDATPTLDDFSNGGSVKMKTPEMEAVQEFTLSDVESMVTDDLLCPYGVACVRPEQVGVVFDGLVFPEPGTYFSRTPDVTQVLSITIHGYTGFVKKRINPEYLPKTSWSNLDGKPFEIVSVSFETGKLDHTLAEIKAILTAGKAALFSMNMCPINVSGNVIEIPFPVFPRVTDGSVKMIATMMFFDADGNFVEQKEYVWDAVSE